MLLRSRPISEKSRKTWKLWILEKAKAYRGGPEATGAVVVVDSVTPSIYTPIRNTAV